MGLWSHDPSTTKAWEGNFSSCQSKLLPKSFRIGKKDQRIEIFLNPEDICFSVETAFLAEKKLLSSFVPFCCSNLTLLIKSLAMFNQA